jgi:hypothetical protein
VAASYAASVDGGTPLLDKVLLDQFSADVARALLALVGRLFYRVGERDNWQVMPWIVGLSGTGKSLLMDVISSLFFEDNVGVLSSNNEAVFGLADKHDKQLLVGRDLPRNMSAVLAQDLLQSMVSGEAVSVPKKNQVALRVKWSTPLVFCSNHMPDYADNAGQVVRRLVVFQTRNVVAEPDTGLLDRIRATELPAFLAKALRAYHAALDEHGTDPFWKWCPEELRAAQRRLGAETSLVRRFMALGPGDPEAVVDGREVYVRRGDDGRSTALTVVAAAYKAFVDTHYHAVKSPERMDKDSLAVAGFVVDKDVNTCKACGKSGGRQCCEVYDRAFRSKIPAVRGVEVVRG